MITRVPFIVVVKYSIVAADPVVTRGVEEDPPVICGLVGIELAVEYKLCVLDKPVVGDKLDI